MINSYVSSGGGEAWGPGGVGGGRRGGREAWGAGGVGGGGCGGRGVFE